MSTQAKQLLIVHPAANLSASSRRMLERNGFAVIVGEPEHFKTAAMLTIGSGDLITIAALEAVKADSYGTVKRDFANRLIELILADRNLASLREATQ